MVTKGFVKFPHHKLGEGLSAQAINEVSRAVFSLQHHKMTGTVQTGHAGLGWEAPQQFLLKISKKQQMSIVEGQIHWAEAGAFPHKGNITGLLRSLDVVGCYYKQLHYLGRHLEDTTSQTQLLVKGGLQHTPTSLQSHFVVQKLSRLLSVWGIQAPSISSRSSPG